MQKQNQMKQQDGKGQQSNSKNNNSVNLNGKSQEKVSRTNPLQGKDKNSNEQQANKNQRIRAVTNDPKELNKIVKRKGFDSENTSFIVKERFIKYLRLIFTDLCAKDNGLSIKAFGLYTFQKYASKLPGYLSKRIFSIISSEKQDSELLILNAQNGAGASNNNNKPKRNNTKKNAVIMMADRDRFVRTLLAIYTGSHIEKRALIFKLLDVQNRGIISKNNVKIAIYHMFYINDIIVNMNTNNMLNNSSAQTQNSSTQLGFNAFLQYLIEKIRIEMLKAKNCNNQSDEQQPFGQACHEVLISFNEQQMIKHEERVQHQTLSEIKVSRQQIIDYLTDDIFKNQNLKLKQKNGDIYLTQEDYIKGGIQMQGDKKDEKKEQGNGEGKVVGLFELMMTYYLKLSFPCAEYFENLMIENFKEIDKYKKQQKQEQINKSITFLKRNADANQQQNAKHNYISIQINTNNDVKEDDLVNPDRLNKNHSKSGFLAQRNNSVVNNNNNNQHALKNSHTQFIVNSNTMLKSKSILQFKGKNGYQTQHGFVKVASQEHNNLQNQNPIILPNCSYIKPQIQQNVGGLNSIQNSDEGAFIEVQPNRLDQQSRGHTPTAKMKIKGAPENGEFIEIRNLDQLKNKSFVNSQGMQNSGQTQNNLSNLGIPQSRNHNLQQSNSRYAKIANSHEYRPEPSSSSQINSHLEESKNGDSRSPSCQKYHNNDQSSKYSNNRLSFPKKSYNRVSIENYPPKQQNPYEKVESSNQKQSIIDDTKQRKCDVNQDDSPLVLQNSGDSNEEESLFGLTQVRDADELLPAEYINHPIVYSLNSNFLVMHQNNESQLIDSNIEKLIQGARGPFVQARPQHINGVSMNQSQLMFQTREINDDILATQKLQKSNETSFAGAFNNANSGSFLALKMLQNRKSQLIQSKCDALALDSQNRDFSNNINNNINNNFKTNMNPTNRIFYKQPTQQHPHFAYQNRNYANNNNMMMMNNVGGIGVQPQGCGSLNQGSFTNFNIGSIIPQNAGLCGMPNGMFRSIVEEEDDSGGESWLDIDQDQAHNAMESLIKHHRKALLQGVPMSVYFQKLYKKLIHKRFEWRKQTIQSQISSADMNLPGQAGYNQAWEVLFKVPDAQQQKGNKKFYIKIEGHDLYCVLDPQQTIDAPKLKFLHCLLGCSFQIKPPEESQTATNNLRQTKNSPHRQDNDQLSNNGTVVLNDQQQQQHGQCIQTLLQQWYQVQVKLSEKHKRVFFVRTKKQAHEIVKRMRIASEARSEIEQHYTATTTQSRSNNDNTQLSSGINNNNSQVQILGQGTYGKVYKAYSKSNQKPVAIKQINKKALILEELELQQHEIHLYKILSDDQCSGVVSLIDVFEDHQQISVVLEFVEGMNLFHWIKRQQPANSNNGNQNESVQLDESRARKVFKEILKIVAFVHSKGIVHRDIKLENIMIKEDTTSAKETTKSKKQTNRLRQSEYQVRLIDFGLSKVLLPCETSTDPYGTLAYCSPEIVTKKPHTTQTDVWSLGIVMYTLLTRRMPFVVSHDLEQTKNNIIHRELNFENPLWQTISEDAKNLLSRMLEKDASTRITCQQALQHPWFQKMNEKSLKK